jgi:hypothetical protein
MTAEAVCTKMPKEIVITRKGVAVTREGNRMGFCQVEMVKDLFHPLAKFQQEIDAIVRMHIAASKMSSGIQSGLDLPKKALLRGADAI